MQALDTQPDDREVHLWARPGDTRLAFILRTISAQLHAVGAVASVVGAVVLLRLTKDAPLTHYVAVAVFGIAAVVLFGTSALQHFLDDGFHISKPLLRIAETLDKFSVYLLIAGTYTPVLYNTLDGGARTAILGLVWTLALSGCLYVAFFERLPRWAQSRFVLTGQYVLLGWTLMLQIRAVFAHLTGAQVGLLLGGGLSYTIGAVAYALKRPNFSRVFGYHELWHLSVMAGCALFFLLVGSFYV